MSFYCNVCKKYLTFTTKEHHDNTKSHLSNINRKPKAGRQKVNNHCDICNEEVNSPSHFRLMTHLANKHITDKELKDYLLSLE